MHSSHTKAQRTARRALLAALLSLLVPLLGQADPAVDWRMDLHDPQRSNFSPGTAHLAAPAVRWRLSMEAGATQVTLVDVDLDGKDDVVIVSGGRLTARSLAGTVLWKTAVLGATGAVRTPDLDGDGLAEVLAYGARALQVIGTSDGQVRWQSPAGLFKSLAGIWFADFDGDGVADLSAADAGSPFGTSAPTAFVWSFASGTGKQIAQTAVPMADGKFANGSGQHALDIDGDDLADMLILETGTLGAFSGKTGKLIATSPDFKQISPLPSAVARVVDPSGGPPLLVWAGDTGNLSAVQQQVGFHVLKREAAALVPVWTMQAATPTEESVRVVAGGIGDLDGDGALEIVDSHYANGAWRLEAWDLKTAQSLSVGQAPGVAPQPGNAGLVLRGAFRLGALTVFVCVEQLDRLDMATAGLRLLTWTRKAGFAQVADLSTGAWWPVNLAAYQKPDDAWKEPVRPLRSLGNGQVTPGLGELLVQRDTNGDQRLDALDRLGLSVGASGQLTVTSLGQYAWQPGTRLLALASAGELQVLTVGDDGRVAAWNTAHKVVNDGDGDGQPDLLQRVGGSARLTVGRRTAQGAPVVVATLGNRVAVLDPAGAGPAKPPKLLWNWSPSDQGALAALADTDGDGNTEVALRYRPGKGNAMVEGRDVLGQPLWAWQWSGPPLAWAWSVADPWWAADLDGDGAEEVFLGARQLVPSAKPTQLATVLLGKTHTSMWSELTACSQWGEEPMGLDLSVTPPRVLRTGYHDRYVCTAGDGKEVLSVKANPATYGVPMMVDLDGQPPLDVVFGGPAVELEADSGATLAPLWHEALAHPPGGPAALAMVAGKPVHVQMVPANAELRARDAKSGALLWSRVYVDGKAHAPDNAPKNSVSISGLATVADLTGKQQPAAIFTCQDGRLYAVSLLDGAVLWTWDFGGVPSRPIPADVDGDGILEIVISTPDGDLAVLDSNVATPPDWVREHGLDGPALSDAADLDTQEETDWIRANWSAVPGATGYAVRLLDDSGGELTIAKDLQGVDATLDGLYLQPGQTYFTAVTSQVSSGADASYSLEAKSDGIQIVDKSPPWFEDLGCAPACAVPAGAAVSLTGYAKDRTRLSAVNLSIDAGSGGKTSHSWRVLTKSQDLTLGLPELALGEHDLSLQAVDLAGHVSTAVVHITICAGTGQPGSTACNQPRRAGTANNDVYGTKAEGCSAPRGPDSGALLGWLLGLAGLVAGVARRRLGE